MVNLFFLFINHGLIYCEKGGSWQNPVYYIKEGEISYDQLNDSKITIEVWETLLACGGVLIDAWQPGRLR
ncbi:MAG TPA: hypothetical protein DEA44_14095 [Firmicutes bacterium]|nr:hypothetical protein [Bacillota bacterium]